PAFFNKDIVDSVGAGDSFNAGFIHQFLKGLPLNECQEFGNLMGALNTTAAGGTTAFAETNTIIERATQKFGYSKSIRKKDENN
ncbi:MAG TPA: PfkB family carbohydrate kinase, partial [Flavitalea sp.]|nr:PfkB family carbohydrate kinase [Flavitalea sp.]